MAKMSSKTKTALLIAGAVALVGISAAALGFSLKAAGAFEPKEYKTNAELMVEWGEAQSGGADSTGLTLFYDDQGTEETTDDTYYKLIRYTAEGDTTNAQSDGVAIIDQNATVLALGKVDLSEKVTLKVKSTYDIADETRETTVYVNGKKVDLRLEAILAEAEDSGVSVKKGVLTDARDGVCGGEGIKVTTDFDGTIYFE